MKLVHRNINKVINLNSEEKINVLIVEHQSLLRELIEDLHNQINKEKGDFILSVDDKPTEIHKYMEIYLDVFALQINKRTLINKLYKSLDVISQNEDLILKTKELYSYIGEYIHGLINETDFELEFLLEYEISRVLKGVDLKFTDSNKSLIEKLIDYMELIYALEGEKCFVFVNLRDFILDNEINEFYKTVLYNKFKILLINAKDYSNSVYEERIIIDEDLCEF